MAQNQLMIGLKRQYAKTLGFIAAGEDRRSDLAHLAAVIRMFSPDENLSAIAPIRPYKPERDRWSADVMTVLRTSGRPMTGREMAFAVLALYRIAPNNIAYLKSVECSIHGVMKRLEGNGVERVSDRPKRWTLA